MGDIYKLELRSGDFICEALNIRITPYVDGNTVLYRVVNIIFPGSINKVYTISGLEKMINWAAYAEDFILEHEIPIPDNGILQYMGADYDINDFIQFAALGNNIQEREKLRMEEKERQFMINRYKREVNQF